MESDQNKEQTAGTGTRDLWLIKAHYFFFFAALGPILPQINVFGKQLGAGPEAMGYIMFALPFLWAIAKFSFGYIVDYFSNQRKLIFILLIVVMSSSYCGLSVLRPPPITDLVRMDLQFAYVRKAVPLFQPKGYLECHNGEMFYFVSLSTYENFTDEKEEEFGTIRDCHFWNKVSSGLKYVDGLATCVFNVTNVFCESDRNTSKTIEVSFDEVSYSHDDFGLDYKEDSTINETEKEDCTESYSAYCNESFYRSVRRQEELQHVMEQKAHWPHLYGHATFWIFVVLSSLGTIAFNVVNCISDAICFDVLDKVKQSSYGVQRSFGTVGYGLTALVSGWLVDRNSDVYFKDFTPAFILVAVFTVADLICCWQLQLPKLSQKADFKALMIILNHKVVIFVIFAIIAGVFDSFIIYYMFWYLEELAHFTGWFKQMKLLEGVIVAGQSFFGELIFFFISGSVIKRFGYGATFTFCLLCYSIRMSIISIVGNPWHLVPAEAIMQGPTYALCYSTIVGYAAQIAPPGYSATVQGFVAGMDDGVGFALGSLVGGQLYGRMGGPASFRVMSVIALMAATVHILIMFVFYRTAMHKEAKVTASLEMTTNDEPEASQMIKKGRDHRRRSGVEHTVFNLNHEPIYRETTEPFHDRLENNDAVQPFLNHKKRKTEVYKN